MRPWASNSSKAARRLRLAGDEREMLIGRYRVPQPRVALAQAVRDHACAAMDVSDGLAGDLAKLCAASDVSAAIDAQSIPLSGPARSLLSRGAVGIESIVSGGDDYEILCTIPENRFEAFAAGRKARRGARDLDRDHHRRDRGSPVYRPTGDRNSAAAPVLQPFLRLFGANPRHSQLPPNTCENRPFSPFAALRCGSDFGMVPPI